MQGSGDLGGELSFPPLKQGPPSLNPAQPSSRGQGTAACGLSNCISIWVPGATPHPARRPRVTGKITLVGPLGLEVAALVGAELGLSGEALGAHLTLEQVLLLVALHVRFEVVHSGELLAAATHGAAERPQFVVRLQMSLEFIGGGEGPAAAVQGAFEGSPALAASVCQ